MTSYRYLLTDASDGVHTIKFNRPERLNALTQDVAKELLDAFEEIDVQANDVVVVRGEGRAFCAGWDLKEASAATKTLEDTRNEIEAMQDLTRAIRKCPLPILSVIHGYAMGAGCEIGLSCDLVLATRTAVFGFPETEVGLAVTGGFTHILPRTIGIVKAKELLFLGRRFTGEQAQGMGLVNFVCEDEAIASELNTIVKDLHSRSKLALRVAKQEIDLGSQLDLETTMKIEVELGVQASLSKEAKARISRIGSR